MVSPARNRFYSSYYSHKKSSYYSHTDVYTPQRPHSSVKCRLNFTDFNTEKSSAEIRTPPLTERRCVYVPTSSEGEVDPNTLQELIEEVLNKHRSASTTESEKDDEIQPEGPLTLSLTQLISINKYFQTQIRQAFDSNTFAIEQTSDFFLKGFPLLQKQDFKALMLTINRTPAYAVDAVICYYHYEKLIKGENKKKLEKFLIEECIERICEIPIYKRCALFKYLQAIAIPFHTSIYALGRCYSTGFGIERNMEKAAAAFFQAAKRGDSQAQFMLGGIYEFFNEDKNKDKDYIQAFQWYKAAHINRLPSATFAIACFYSSGIGCTKNLDKALKYCRQAVQQKVLGARFLLSILYREGPEKKRNIEKSIKWCCKGIKYGKADYQAIYGLLSVLHDTKFHQVQKTNPDLEKRKRTAKRLSIIPIVARKPIGLNQKEFWVNPIEFPQEIGSEQNEVRRQFFLKTLMGKGSNRMCPQIRIT